MAEKDVLSQEEIDALLHSVDSEDGDAADVSAKEEAISPDDVSEAPPPPTVSHTDDVVVHDFANQQRMVRGQLPVLDRIYERTARLFASEIYEFTARDFEIRQEAMLITKHIEYIPHLPNPTYTSMFRFKPLRGKGLVYFDSVFIYDLVDYYFGGNSQFSARKDRTDFTPTELSVMQSVTTKLVQCLVKAWDPILPLEAIKLAEETNPQLVHISEPDEILLVHQFFVNFGKEEGLFAFIMPYPMMEPVRQQLELGAARPDDEIDPNWINSLKQELMDVDLTVSSAMAETRSSLREVVEWQVGDFIPVEMKEVMTLDIEGTPSFVVDMGNVSDKQALKIKEKISY